MKYLKCFSLNWAKWGLYSHSWNVPLFGVWLFVLFFWLWATIMKIKTVNAWTIKSICNVSVIYQVFPLKKNSFETDTALRCRTFVGCPADRVLLSSGRCRCYSNNKKKATWTSSFTLVVIWSLKEAACWWKLFWYNNRIIYIYSKYHKCNTKGINVKYN